MGNELTTLCFFNEIWSIVPRVTWKCLLLEGIAKFMILCHLKYCISKDKTNIRDFHFLKGKSTIEDKNN